MLETVVIVLHLLGAIGIVVLVLLQQGKGAEAGASFGSGASATVFGSQGSATFLSKFTGILAAAFFITSLGLAHFAKQQSEAISQIGLPDASVLEVQESPVVEDVPVFEEQVETSTGLDVPQAPEQ